MARGRLRGRLGHLGGSVVRRSVEPTNTLFSYVLRGMSESLTVVPDLA